jgi:aminocarboxymuconate-semialdehyde decarboxylase
MNMNFDMHSHFIPQEFVDAISKPGSGLQAKLIKKGDEPWILHDQGYGYPLSPGFHDTKARLADMERTKLDMAAVSASPTLFYYWAEPKLGLEVARMTNNAIYNLTKEHPGKFVGMGTLPMQDVSLAITELRFRSAQMWEASNSTIPSSCLSSKSAKISMFSFCFIPTMWAQRRCSLSIT